MIPRSVIVETARTWIGTKWQHQARLKDVGCDCAGLVIGVAREVGIKGIDFDVTAYGRLPTGRELATHCGAHMRKVAKPEMQIGDVVLMKFEGEPQHLAILGNYHEGGLSIIHAYSLARKVVETRLDDLWSSRIVIAYGMPGVE